MKNYKWASTTYYYNTKGVTGLYIREPRTPSQILSHFSSIKALCFFFNQKGFKNKNINEASYLKDFLNQTNLEYLEIRDADDISHLPVEIIKQPIQEIRIHACSNLCDLSVLSKMKFLKTVRITGAKVTFGKDFYQSKTLKNLFLQNTEVTDIKRLPWLKNLETLHLRQLLWKTLPTGIERLNRLKSLTVFSCIQLQTLPKFGQFEALRHLKLHHLPNIKTIPNEFEGLNNLDTVEISNISKEQDVLEIPASLGRNTALKHLNIQSSPVFVLPEFEKGNTLISLSLSNLPIQTLGKSLSQLSCLNSLSIKGCILLRDLSALSHLKKLEDLHLEDLLSADNFDFSFINMPALEKLFLKGLSNMKRVPSFGEHNINIKEIALQSLPALKIFPTSLLYCTQLQSLKIEGTNLVELPSGLSTFKHLDHLIIRDNTAMAYLPSVLIKVASARFIVVNCLQFYQGNNLLSLIRFVKEKAEQDLQVPLAYHLFNNYKKEPLTNEIKQGLLTGLGLPNVDLRLLLFSQLYQLNPDAVQLKNIKIKAGETVGIIGTTQNKRTILKAQIKALDLKYSAKINEQTHYVLVAKKPKVPVGFWEQERILFSENEFMEYQKAHKPGLLQQKDTPKDFIHNLRQLLWSNDPANEAVALELVINNGLPNGLDMDFIVVAKTSKDKNLRNKIRKFLKGNLTESSLKVLNDRTLVKQKYPPFYKYGQYIKPTQIAQFIVTLYQRSGIFLSSFFRYDDGDSLYRRLMFEALLPELLEKPKYLKLNYGLKETEINEVLNKPMFEDKLERLVINSHLMKKIPDSVYKHVTLKNLELQGNFEKTTLPMALFSLYKLNKVKLTWKNLAIIPLEITQLTRLREIMIYTKQPLSLPDNFIALKKVKRVYISGGMIDKAEWVEKMPNCSF